MTPGTAELRAPWPVPDEAVDAAAEAIRNTMLGRDYKGSPSDLRTDLRAAVAAALPFVMFGPLGDNHHNAALCPYCAPRESPDQAVTHSTPATAALCPAFVPVSDAPCFIRLPCAFHGVTDAEDAAAKYGCVYEQREGEVALHVYPKVPDAD